MEIIEINGGHVNRLIIAWQQRFCMIHQGVVCFACASAVGRTRTGFHRFKDRLVRLCRYFDFSLDRDSAAIQRFCNPTWLNLVFKSGADFGEGVAEVVG